MSRYATKAELIEVVKSTIATDHCNLGTPKDTKAFNLAGIIRDIQIIGDGHYGYTMNVGPDEFKTIIKRHLRPGWQTADA